MPDPLRDHVVVLSHLQPHVIGHRQQTQTLGDVLERSGVDISDLPPGDLSREVVGQGEPIVITGAPHHIGQQKFTEVSWTCSCGGGLHSNPDQVPRAWALHAAVATGLDSGVLAGHPVLSISGERATVTCACGRQFYAGDEDPTDPGAPLAAWEAHVREAG